MQDSLHPLLRLPSPVPGLLALRNRHFLLFDLLILLFTPLLALALRVDVIERIPPYLPYLIGYALVALLIRLVCFHYFGLYQRYWRYAGPAELGQIGVACLCATALICALFFSIKLSGEWLNLPRSVPLIDGLLALVFVTCNRASIRMAEQWASQRYSVGELTRVAIVGAGRTGELMAREIQQNQGLNWQIVAFIDDDRLKHNMQIRGVPVLGGRHALAKLVQERAVDRVIIAMPNAPGVEVRRIVAQCRQADVQTQIVPGLHELLNGAVSVSRLRNVEIEDLLRRTPVQTDTGVVRQLLHGKRVLVTGAGGSIGSELCRQILRGQPSQLILVGHGENSVFEISNELQRALGEMHQGNDGPSVTILPVIADLRFAERLHSIFRQHRPQVVFHAAAHKHVPLMEAHPAEAITNNVLGTQNLLAAAQASKVERFVMISSDKAVNPTSVMGTTKRIAEFLVYQAAQATGLPYQVVRFGNVLGSRGSVVLTFRKQIAAGGPVTVTHPDMVRYFMTIPEAVQLVLQASILGKGGEVFMLDMGEPVKIVDLARDLIQLSGFEVGRDIEIAFSGMRPGEKLFEEMFTSAEIYTRTLHEKILIAADACRSLPADLNEAVADLVRAAWRDDVPSLMVHLRHLVPEYLPQERAVRRPTTNPGRTSSLPSATEKRPLLQPLPTAGD